MDIPAIEGPDVTLLCCETMLQLSTSIANYRCKKTFYHQHDMQVNIWYIL